MKLIDFFKQNKISLKAKTLVVASSGGPDSMALTQMLFQLKEQYHFSLIIAHFDHQLRPNSAQETKLLEKYCQKRQLLLINGKWSKNQQPKVGIEAAARTVRYAFLSDVVKKYHGDYLLTAHHNDDLLENILLKFIRSGNPQEMNSLQAVGQMNGIPLLRPLLEYSKQELLAYDQAKQIAYIIDETNNEDDTMRNRLRHHIVPQLKKENPQLGQNALRFSCEITTLTSLVANNLAQLPQPKRFLEVSYRIAKQALQKLSEQQQLLYWRDFIWKKYHLRVGNNLAGFKLKEYQNYLYLWPLQLNMAPQLKTIKVNQKFNFRSKTYLLSDKQTTGKLLAKLHTTANDFKIGTLPVGTKLRLKNGQHVKAKKMFAQAAIPLTLRQFCLTIYTAQLEVLYIEKTYQNQYYQPNDSCFYLYQLKNS